MRLILQKYAYPIAALLLLAEGLLGYSPARRSRKPCNLRFFNRNKTS